MKYNIINIKKIIVISIIFIVICIIASYPLFYMLDISTDDGAMFHCIIDGMKNNFLNRHQLPYRINMDFYYGLQVPIFYHLTFLYTTFIFNMLLKFNDMQAFNLVIVLINILTMFSMFITSKSICKKNHIALLSTILYELCIYRLINIYRRGAFGETISYMFVPLFILSLYKMFLGEDNKAINKGGYLFVFTSSSLLQNHTLSTYLYFIITILLLIIFVFIINNKKEYCQKLLSFIKFSFFTFLFNAWYIFPIIYEFLFVDFINPAFYLGNSIFAHPTNIRDLFIILPSYFSSYNNIGFSYTILFAFSLFCVINLFRKKKGFTKTDKFFIVLFIISVIVYLLTFDFVPFDLIRATILKRFVDVLQFRFRLFIIVVPFVSISAPYLIFKIFDSLKMKILISSVLIFVSLVSSITYINSVLNAAEFKNYYVEKWNLDYFLTGTLSDDIFNYDYTLIISDNGINIKKSEFHDKYIKVDYSYHDGNYKNKYIVFPLFNYPVYKVYDGNNKLLNKETGVNNLIKVNLYNRIGTIIVKYEEPLFWQIGNYISLSCLIFIIFIFIKKYLLKKYLSNKTYN